MLSIILVPIWGILYFYSPYLFVASSSFLYFTQWHDEVLNVLITFPLGLFYIQQQLKSGEKPEHPNTLIWEFIRWILFWVLAWKDWFPQAQSYSLAGYAYTTGLVIIMISQGLVQSTNIVDQTVNEVKFRAYVIWTFWIVYILILNPIELCVALCLHALNFLIDFRLADHKQEK